MCQETAETYKRNSIHVNAIRYRSSLLLLYYILHYTATKEQRINCVNKTNCCNSIVVELLFLLTHFNLENRTFYVVWHGFTNTRHHAINWITKVGLCFNVKRITTFSKKKGKSVPLQARGAQRVPGS